MIISHKNKYLFVEIPQTGSTAISQELCTLYDGQEILKKHSFFFDFLEIASPEEKNYFVFAGIRNPLDEAVSFYYKLKTNHHERYLDPKKLKNVGAIKRIRVKRRFEEIRNTNINFETYFLKHYKRPYNNFANLIIGYFDFLIRFENLQEDFAQVLRLIGLEPKRPLPVRNPTAGRNRDFWSYYSPTTIPRAKRVFGHFMKQWGYEFPPEWGDCTFRWWNNSEFEIFSLLRRFKWKYLRFIS